MRQGEETGRKEASEGVKERKRSVFFGTEKQRRQISLRPSLMAL